MLFVRKKNNSGTKYSKQWINSLSDEEWETEREKIRIEYCRAKDDHTVNKMQSILDRFDLVWGKKHYSEEDSGSIIHKEHGWYLESDD